MKSKKKRTFDGDKFFGLIIIVFVVFAVILTLYPLIYVLSASISSPHAVNRGEMWLLPVDITFEGYKRVFRNNEIWMGYRNTIFYTVTGVICHLAVTVPGAYALACNKLPGRKVFNRLFMFTMFFGGGLIPSYLLYRSLGILDSIWAVILPGATGYYNIAICKAFFNTSIPPELEEAAEIDGANVFYRFFNIVLPLSSPIIAVTALFHGVGRWNSYFSEMIVLKDSTKYPLQVFLKEILFSAQVTGDMVQDPTAMAVQALIAGQVKYGAIVVSTLPVILIYPFLQKYFVKGILIGSVKG